MLHVRPGVIRMAAASVAGAGCLAAVACSGVSASSLSVVPRASSTADPLAALTVAQLEAKTIADEKAASSVTLDGSSVQSGEADTIEFAIKPGKGCTGTVGTAAQGSVKLILIGDTLYLDPDNKYWAASAGADAQQVIATVGGRYIKVSTADKTLGPLASACDLSQMFSTNGKKDDIAKGSVTTRDGIRVLALHDLTDGSTGYLTDTSTPLLVALTAPKGSKNGAENATVTYGAPVTLTAPPASQVVDGSKFGL